MARYWLHALAVVIAIGLVGGACVVRTTPAHRHHAVHGKHKKHKKHKHKKPKKHVKHKGGDRDHHDD